MKPRCCMFFGLHFACLLLLPVMQQTVRSEAPRTLPNASFEAPLRSWRFSTWEPAGGPVSRGAILETGAHHGTRSAHIRGLKQGNHGYWFVRGLPIQAGKRTVLTAWIKQRLPLDGSYVHLSLGFSDAAGSIIADEDRPFYLGWSWLQRRGTADWGHVGVECVAPPEAVSASVTLKLVGRGEAWFDDLALHQDPAVPLPASAPGLGQNVTLDHTQPVAGEVTFTFTVTNPFEQPLEDLQITLAEHALPDVRSKPAAAAQVLPGDRVSLPLEVSFPGDAAANNTALRFAAACRVDDEVVRADFLAQVDLVSADLLAAVQSDRWGLLPSAHARPGDSPCSLLGVVVDDQPPAFTPLGSALDWPTREQADIGLVFRLAEPGDEHSEASLRVEILDYFWRSDSSTQTVLLPPKSVHLLKIPIRPQQAQRIRHTLSEGGAPCFRVQYSLHLAGGTVTSGRRDLSARLTEPLPAYESPAMDTRVDLPPFGTLRLVDQVECGDPNDPHPLRQGGKGLLTKQTGEPLDYYGNGTRLSYDWHLDYRDRRDHFSRTEPILDQPCRAADDWGWFAYRLGGGNLKQDTYYVLAITYPEDVSRNFLVWNGIDTRASFGWHTGDALGDPYTRQRIMQQVSLPLSGRFETWTALCRSRVTGSAWVSIHSMGQRAAPLQHGVAVQRIALYELGDSQALAALACEALEPAAAPRRLLGHIQEDAVPSAEDLPHYRFLGLNCFAPLALAYGGGTYETNSGSVRWSSALFGAAAAPLSHPLARRIPGYYNLESPAALRRILEVSTRNGTAIFPVLEYAGTGQLPEEALALDPEQKPHGFHWGSESGPDGRSRPRYLKDGWCIDITHPAVAADCAALAREVATQFALDYPAFGGIILTPRFAAWQVSYSPDALRRFARDSNTNIPAGTATEQAEWVQTNARDAFMLWHAHRKREVFRTTAKALRDIRSDLRLLILNYNSGDDNLPVAGSVLHFRDREQGDSFVVPGSVCLPDFTGIDLVALMEDYRRPEMAMGALGMQPYLYRTERGILNLAPVRYPFSAGNTAYLDSFRTGEGSAVCLWWIYNEDAYRNHAALGWNCPGLQGNEAAGPYCMMDEVLSLAAADPLFMAVRIGRMNRGFPAVAREFARAYRALPAVPMQRLTLAGVAPEVVIRHARVEQTDYLAVINTGLAREGTVVQIPWEIGAQDGLAGVDLGRREALQFQDGQIRLDLAPMSLRSLAIRALQVP